MKVCPAERNVVGMRNANTIVRSTWNHRRSLSGSPVPKKSGWLEVGQSRPRVSRQYLVFASWTEPAGSPASVAPDSMFDSTGLVLLSVFGLEDTPCYGRLVVCAHASDLPRN